MMLEDSILAKYGDVSDQRKIGTLCTCINLPIIKQITENLPITERKVYEAVNDSKRLNTLDPKPKSYWNLFCIMMREDEKIDNCVQRLKILSTL